MDLLKLSFRNFKKIKEFIFEPGGRDADIFGDNATGKTTICDGLFWLLFDQDSGGRSQFTVKCLTKTGEEIHNLEHEVEGVFLVGGKTITLKKVFFEKWTKKRGSAEKEFSGHTTEYFANDVPVKKKDYMDKVKEVAVQDVFKLLTSPSFFPEKMKWQDRRTALLDVCGNVSDQDVIASSKELAPLADILKDRTLEDHKKTVTSQKSAINKQLEKIPTRIDEVERGLPEIPENIESIKVGIDELTGLITDKNEEYTRIKNGGQVSEKQKELTEIDTGIIALKNSHAEKEQEATGKINAAINDLAGVIDGLVGKKNRAEAEVAGIPVSIKKNEDMKEELRQEWHKINEEVFNEDSCICPTCKQEMPTEQVDAARIAFNESKAKKLAEIDESGITLKKVGEELQEKISEHKNAIEDLSSEISLKEANLASLKRDRDAKDTVGKFEESPGYVAAQKDRERITKEIEALKSDNNTELLKVGAAIDRLSEDKKELVTQINTVAEREKGEARIKELSEEEKTLAKEYERLDRELFLMEEFIKAKVSLLESNINSKFELARFKLFNEQVNGGLQECCEVLYNGVPFSTNLNSAARTNVGLDIIRTLSAHHNFYPPIFIDNAESVTELLPMDAQVVRLVVSADDKDLRVEVAA